MLDVSSAVAAFAMGIEDARAIKVGDVWRGAFASAEARGFSKGSREFDSFVSGYAGELRDAEIWTDRETLVVTSIRLRKSEG